MVIKFVEFKALNSDLIIIFPFFRGLMAKSNVCTFCSIWSSVSSFVIFIPSRHFFPQFLPAMLRSSSVLVIRTRHLDDRREPLRSHKQEISPIVEMTSTDDKRTPPKNHTPGKWVCNNTLSIPLPFSLIIGVKPVLTSAVQKRLFLK